MTIGKNIILLAIFSLSMLFSMNLHAQWKIPAEYNSKKAPSETTVDNALKGKAIYMKNCKACHNVPGATGLKSPAPPDLGTKDFQKSSEGKIYYQMTKGNGAGMGAYEKVLSDDDRWNIVHYLNTFREGNTVDLASAQQDLALKVDFDNEHHKIKAKIENCGDNASGIAIFFGKKTYFTGEYDDVVNGEKTHTVIEPLKLGVVKTDTNGVASFDFPTDLPGDEEGNVNLIVKFVNKDRFGKAVVEQKVAWGKKLHIVNMADERELWSSHTPIWLLLTYSIVVIGVWAVIFYVIFLILKIKKAGKEVS